MVETRQQEQDAPASGVEPPVGTRRQASPHARPGGRFQAWTARERRGSLLAGLIAAAATALLCGGGALQRLEWLTQDARLQLRPPRETRARIVIVEVAESTLQAPEAARPMAYWGGLYGAAIRQARAAGATWIGLDILQNVDALEETDAALAAANRELARALRSGGVVLPNLRVPGRDPVNPLPTLLFAHRHQTENIGFINALPDADGVLRQAPVYFRDGERVVPSFPALLALRARGQHPDPRAVAALAPPETTSPRVGAVRINYLGRRDGFPRMRLEHLMRGELTPRQKDWLRGAVVLVGPTHDGANDIHLGPDRAYDGVEVHAHALATLLDGRPLRRAPGLEAHAAAAVGVLLALALPALPFGAGLVLALAAAGLWGVLAVSLFSHDFLLPVAGPWLGITLATAAHYGVRSTEEARRHRWLQGLFGRYVSTGIVEHLLENPAHLRLGGEERDVSVLFVDIRGFTTYSEGRSPAAVMNDLNTLFAEIVPVIDRHRGLLYKYTGDGLLAVFGAPQPLPEHAQAAVDAAAEVIRAGWRLGTRMGCAVHSGLVVCGNIGVAARSEYTVIGDTVNLAARIEELNKQLEASEGLASEVLISEETCARLEALPAVRGPFEFQVRGREARVRVYQVRVSHA